MEEQQVIVDLLREAASTGTEAEAIIERALESLR
jgi:hypothetical protein